MSAGDGVNPLIVGPQTWWTRLVRSVDWVIVTITIGVTTAVES